MTSSNVSVPLPFFMLAIRETRAGLIIMTFLWWEFYSIFWIAVQIPAATKILVQLIHIHRVNCKEMKFVKLNDFNILRTLCSGILKRESWTAPCHIRPSIRDLSSSQSSMNSLTTFCNMISNSAFYRIRCELEMKWIYISRVCHPGHIFQLNNLCTQILINFSMDNMPDRLSFSSQSSWLQIKRSGFAALPDFLRSSGSGTGSTQPHEYNSATTWKKK
jgi:hypothetical protein